MTATEPKEAIPKVELPQEVADADLGDNECQLLIIRHGETDWNVKHILQGQEDVSLNDTGREQSRRCGKYLKDNIHTKELQIITSDLSRALETARLIAEDADIPKSNIIKEPGFREHDFGVVAGHTWSEALEKYDDDIKRWATDANFPLPDGESLNHRFDRVKTALYKAIENNFGKRLVIIAHGAVIKDISRIAMERKQLPKSGLRATNCSISVLRCLVQRSSSGRPGDIEFPSDPVSESESLLEEEDKKYKWDILVSGVVSHLIQGDGVTILSSTRKLLPADDAEQG